MSLSLVRVDDRLIHGQVLLMWTKVRLGDAIILLVDDKLANDQFLKTVFINAGNGLGKKVYNNIYLSPRDIEYCDFLEAKGIKILFKLIPDEKGLTLSDVKTNYKGGK